MTQSNINPENPRQQRVFFHLQAADDANEKRHPQLVMSELAAQLNFKIIGAVSQSLFDGWDYWIEADEAVVLPEFLRVHAYTWKPVGQA